MVILRYIKLDSLHYLETKIYINDVFYLLNKILIEFFLLKQLFLENSYII